MAEGSERLSWLARFSIRVSSPRSLRLVPLMRRFYAVDIQPAGRVDDSELRAAEKGTIDAPRYLLAMLFVAVGIMVILFTWLFPLLQAHGELLIDPTFNAIADAAVRIGWGESAASVVASALMLVGILLAGVVCAAVFVTPIWLLGRASVRAWGSTVSVALALISQPAPSSLTDAATPYPRTRYALSRMRDGVSVLNIGLTPPEVRG